MMSCPPPPPPSHPPPRPGPPPVVGAQRGARLGGSGPPPGPARAPPAGTRGPAREWGGGGGGVRPVGPSGRETIAPFAIPALDGAVSDRTEPNRTREATLAFLLRPNGAGLDPSDFVAKTRHLFERLNCALETFPVATPPPKKKRKVHPVAMTLACLASGGWPCGKGFPFPRSNEMVPENVRGNRGHGFIPFRDPFGCGAHPGPCRASGCLLARRAGSTQSA